MFPYVSNVARFIISIVFSDPCLCFLQRCICVPLCSLGKRVTTYSIVVSEALKVVGRVGAFLASDQVGHA